MNLFLFLSIIYIVLFISGKKVYAKDQDFVDNDANPDDTASLSGTPNHPYVGIPIGTWKITDLSNSDKEDLCTRQQSFCSSECGGESLITKKSTMSWMCTCQNHVPDTPPYRWPITLAECQGRENSCISGCTYGATKAICIKACNKYFKCNQAGSPLSGLKVEREDQIPTYSLPGSAKDFFSSSSSSLWLSFYSRHSIMKYTTLLHFFVYIIFFY